MKILKNRLKNH